MRSSLGVSALALGLAVASVARAQSPATTAAEALFQQAKEMLAEGKVPEACAKFAESNKLDPERGTLLNLAACHVKEGKTATAWTDFSELRDRAQAAGDTKRADYASAQLTVLGKTLARVQIHLAPGVIVTAISIDGSPVGQAAWEVPIPLDPGEHSFSVTAQGKVTKVMTVVVPRAPGVQVVEVNALDDVPSAPPSPAPLSPASVLLPEALPPAEATTSRLGGGRIAALFLGGAGVVALGLGTYFAVTAISKKNDSDSNCPGGNAGPCNSTGVSLSKDAVTAGNLSSITFGVGLAAIAAGALLWWTAPKPTASAGALHVGAGAGPGGVNVALWRSF